MIRADGGAVQRWTLPSAAVSAGFGLWALVIAGFQISRNRTLWYDEAVTAVAVDRPIRDVIAVMVNGDHAGMGHYFLALRAWTIPFGSGDASLRWFSALGGAATVALVVELTRRWWGMRPAVIAGTLAVLNPFFLRYLTEVRSYGWTMFLSLLATALLVRAARTGEKRWFVAYGASVGVALGFHFLFVVVVAGNLAWLAVSRQLRGSLTGLSISGVAALVVFGPSVLATLRNDGPASWIPELSPSVFLLHMRLLAGGSLWLGLVAVALVVSLAPPLRGLFDRKTAESTHGRSAIDLLPPCAVAVPIVALVVVASRTPVFLNRYLAGVWPWAIIMLAVVADRLAGRLRPVIGGAVASACLLALLIVWVQADPFDRLELEDPRVAAAYVNREFEEGDVIVFIPRWARYSFLRYGPDLHRADFAVENWPSGKTKPVLVPGDIAELRLRNATRVWIVDNGSGAGRPDANIAGLTPEVVDSPTLDSRTFGRMTVRLVEPSF